MRTELLPGIHFTARARYVVERTQIISHHVEHNNLVTSNGCPRLKLVGQRYPFEATRPLDLLGLHRCACRFPNRGMDRQRSSGSGGCFREGSVPGAVVGERAGRGASSEPPVDGVGAGRRGQELGGAAGGSSVCGAAHARGRAARLAGGGPANRRRRRRHLSLDVHRRQGTGGGCARLPPLLQRARAIIQMRIA